MLLVPDTKKVVVVLTNLNSTTTEVLLTLEGETTLDVTAQAFFPPDKAGTVVVGTAGSATVTLQDNSFVVLTISNTVNGPHLAKLAGLGSGRSKAASFNGVGQFVHDMVTASARALGI